MQDISILKVENPSCLWGRVVQGLGGDGETSERYRQLHVEMNLFYHDATQDTHRLKLTSLQKGQVCVVYSLEMKLWCRAVVESVTMHSDCCQACCLLVDHGERIIVPSDQIWMAMENFLQLPFWVKKFHLAGIKPITLRVCLFEEKAELRPSAHWDCSATLYLHNLVKASARTEAVLLESKSDSTSIELYLTINNIKIWVNDDLVVKKFAYYSRKSADSDSLDEGDRLPVMLASRSHVVSTASNKLTSQTQPLPGLYHSDDCSDADQGLRLVTSQSPSAAGAGDWLTAPSPPQNQQQELVTSDGEQTSKVTEQHLYPSSQWRSGADIAAADSDSSEDTDLSLAAALTKNVNLFRFLKFLNPGSSFQQAAPSVGQSEEPKEMTVTASACTKEVLTPSHYSKPVTSEEQVLLPVSSGNTGAENLESREIVTNEETSNFCSSIESKPAVETQSSEKERACSRLLEWLNPARLNPDPDAEDVVVSPIDPRRSGILVHSALPVDPCSSLNDAPITDALRWVLRRKHYCALSPADCYSWPAVARGCNTIIISNNTDQPLSYLTPLLTHILLNSVFTSFTSSSGPIAVVLCPGWEKVQAVYDLLEESKISQTLHPAIVILGIGKDEAKNVKIPKNCLLLVTTPFTLVRLLSCHCFLFLRLYHLVLDEADQLFTLAPDQMATILQHFQKITSSEENASCPQQLIATAKKWTSHMEGVLANHMPYPSIIITVPEEAALYGNVQQVVLMTLENCKISVLLGTLDFNREFGQKTLIVADSFQEVEDVFKAVRNTSAFCLKIHEGLLYEIDFVIQEWKRDIGPGTHVILVTTNECLKGLGFRDATCVIHYSFPSSPKLFGSRLFCMAENFRNLSEQVCPQDQTGSSPHVIRSVLLISERNVRHVVGILRYLGRTNAMLPSELLSFAQGVHVAWEDQKMDRPLCSYVKSFGVCSRQSSICPDRHRFISQLDQSELPASGVIDVVPLYIKTASVFYGRIIVKDDGAFDRMASEMASYYADKKPGAKELLEGGLYAVQVDDVFHRVKILSVLDRGDRLFFSLFVRFIDVGKEEEVRSHQILELPDQFHSLPGQAVEIVVCRVKPADSETSWHPKVTRAISQKIRGLQHRARVVLSLGNTVFVDPMVRVTQVPGMNTLINEYSVQMEILRTGMGVSNLEHVDLLKALWEDDNRCKDVSYTSMLGHVRISTEEEVLANTFRDSEVRKFEVPDPPRLEPLRSPSGNWSLVSVPAAPEVRDQTSQSYGKADNGQTNFDTADMKPAEQTESTRDGEVCQPTSDTTFLNPDEKGAQEGAEQSNRQQIICTNGNLCDASKILHPQIRWYQTSHFAFLKVKLMNLKSQNCDFYQDRVVYSGSVNGQTYRADLELHQNIAAEVCSWEMKSNEPVIKLVKQQRGTWEKLLKNKNIFVSYDMDHFDEDEDEDREPNGLWFGENTGEDNWYQISQSESDSDSQD